MQLASIHITLVSKMLSKTILTNDLDLYALLEYMNFRGICNKVLEFELIIGQAAIADLSRGTHSPGKQLQENDQ